MAGVPITSSGSLEVTELYGYLIPHNDFPVAIDGIVSIPAEELERDSQCSRKRWPVTPGTHTLRLGSGWLKSPEVSFTVAADQTARFLTRRRAVSEKFLTEQRDHGQYSYQQRSRQTLISEFYLLCSVFKHDLWITILRV